MFLEKLQHLQPAGNQEVNVFAPYFQGKKRALIPLALSLLGQGSLEGERGIEGGESVPFLATWNVAKLPLDVTRVRIQFDGNPELTYEVMMHNSELMDNLIDVMIKARTAQVVDFPQAFYRKLLAIELSATQS